MVQIKRRLLMQFVAIRPARCHRQIAAQQGQPCARCGNINDKPLNIVALGGAFGFAQRRQRARFCAAGLMHRRQHQMTVGGDVEIAAGDGDADAAFDVGLGFRQAIPFVQHLAQANVNQAQRRNVSPAAPFRQRNAVLKRRGGTA